MSRVTPIPWYGGKYNHLNFIHDILLEKPHANRFIVTHGGSGVVLWNRDPVDIETWNDIDSELHNYMKTILHDEDELMEIIEDKSWYGRQLFDEAHQKEPEDDVMRAFYFLIRNGMAYDVESDGWASSIGTSRRGRAQKVSAWESRAEQIKEVHERMTSNRLRKHVQIENKDALNVIERHDHENAMFYCDPPYPEECRGSMGQYNFEMSDEQHRELASTLDDIDGYAAVSSYECELMNELYEGWFIHTDSEKGLAGKGTGNREEVVYTNYDPDTAEKIA